MLFDLQATDKEGVINEMVQSLVDNSVVIDYPESWTVKHKSTGLGDGIAMPHSKTKQLKKQSCLQIKQGCDYASLDGRPTDLFFMIAAPEGANDTHFWQLLLELSKYFLMKPGFADNRRADSWSRSQLWCRRARSRSWRSEQKLSKKQLHLTNLSSLPLRTTGRPHLHGRSCAPIKKREEKLRSALKPTASGAGKSLDCAEEIPQKLKGSSLLQIRQLETARFDGKTDL